MTFRTRVVAAVLFGAVLFLTRLFAQASAPAYLAVMPSVERVIETMRTSDPGETAARQMAAFTHLKNTIEKLAGGGAHADSAGITGRDRGSAHQVPREDFEDAETRRGGTYNGAELILHLSKARFTSYFNPEAI
jgi:hypothetical protein